MLSVLIPTYNYSALQLVNEILRQCEEAQIIFEIVVSDDGSNDKTTLSENLIINNLSYSRFEQNPINLGRAGNMNLLSKKAQYEWLLFMDCDTFPKEKNFISNYLGEIQKSDQLVHFGGICYKENPPNTNQILRWKYGRKREEIKASDRQKHPYKNTLTSNILIHKTIFQNVTFNLKITEYGYEDWVFVTDLQSEGVTINHIDNPTYHLNYETSKIFLEKTKKALETLVFIEESKLISTEKTKVQKAYKFLQKFKLSGIFCYFFNLVFKKIEHQLVSSNPSLLFFDFYKLGYYTRLKSNR
ncbi:glycosyltransferase family 2 protein [Flavobacterium sp. GCM10027622]|uniref:glycosyltransferase family 2 protein n=1 Tax=unclassified Flavobacterium TaxID=196869 RepID=UPI00360A0A30